MTTTQLIKPLTSFIQSEMQRLHIPGVALGILYEDKVFAAGFGMTSVANPLPITPDTLLQIGSITKTVTATVAMRMVQTRHILLDAPVRAYLPRLKLADEETARRLTLRHLLTHTGGFTGDYFQDFGDGDDALEKIVANLHRLPQITPLGEIWSYNNAGWYIAARVLEVVSGKPVEKLIKEKLLEPLGMKHSFFFPNEIMTYRFASGHEAVFGDSQEQPKIARPWQVARTGNAIGGLSSTIHDMLRYARFHLGDGSIPRNKLEANSTAPAESLLSPALLKLMQTPRVPTTIGQFMGLSWFIREIDGVRVVRHGGATNGQMACFEFVPEKGYAIVVLTNSDRGDELYEPLKKMAMRLFLNLDEKDPQPLPADEATLAQYTGDYSAPLSVLTLYMKNGELWLKQIPQGGFPDVDSPPAPAPPDVRLALCGEDRLMIIDEPGKNTIGEILRNADGAIAWLRIHGRIHKKIG